MREGEPGWGKGGKRKEEVGEEEGRGWGIGRRRLGEEEGRGWEKRKKEAEARGRMRLGKEG